MTITGGSSLSLSLPLCLDLVQEFAWQSGCTASRDCQVFCFFFWKRTKSTGDIPLTFERSQTVKKKKVMKENTRLELWWENFQKHKRIWECGEQARERVEGRWCKEWRRRWNKNFLWLSTFPWHAGEILRYLTGHQTGYVFWAIFIIFTISSLQNNNDDSPAVVRFPSPALLKHVWELGQRFSAPGSATFTLWWWSPAMAPSTGFFW